MAAQILRCRLVLACATFIAVAPSALRAAESTYDMSIFINQPHPFAQGAATKPIAPEPVNDAVQADDDVVEEESYFDGDRDPLEPLNRMVFQFNQLLTDLVLEPAAVVYETVLPDEARSSIGKAMNNLGGPVVLANDLLQGEFDRAWNTTQRTVVNSTVGVAGLFDVASAWGIEGHGEDFGQTLGVWGVDEYMFLMLPVFGPSSPRAAIGKFAVDGRFDAFGHLLGEYGNDASALSLQVIAGINQYSNVRTELKTVESTSIDFYAAVRSLYRQNRASEIANSKGVFVPDDLDYELEEFDDEDL